MKQKNKKVFMWVIICILALLFIVFLLIPRKIQENKLDITNQASSTASTGIISNIIQKIKNGNGASSSNTTSIPKGIFTLLSAEKDSTDILNNPNVKGIAIVNQWPDIELTKGHYNWSTADEAVNKTIAANKVILLRLTSGGQNTPAWAMSGAQTFSFIDPNEYHGGTYGKEVKIPVFWDQTFLNNKINFIKESGMHFAGKNISLVAASCANASTNDWNTLSKNDVDYKNWLNIGFTPDKLINACEQIIDATASAYPNSIITLSVSSSGKMDPSPDYISQSVSTYAIKKYPGRFIIEKNGLAAKTPDPTTKTALGASWQEMYDFRPNIAGQMLWFVTNDPTCRMNSMQKPCDAKTMLDSALTSGAHYGMQFIEVYAKDVMNPALQDSLKNANLLLGA